MSCDVSLITVAGWLLVGVVGGGLLISYINASVVLPYFCRRAWDAGYQAAQENANVSNDQSRDAGQ